MYLGTPLKQCGVLSQGKKVQFMSRCGIILQIFCENSVKKALSKIGCYVLLLARQNLKLKNSYILAKTGCLQQKLQDLKNYNIIFPLESIYFCMMVIKTSKKPKILIFIGVHPGLKFAPH